jgi:hypothetical protein
LRIGVALEAFLDWPLERVLAWLPEGAAVQAVCDAMETSAATGRWGEDQRGDEHGAALGG